MNSLWQTLPYELISLIYEYYNPYEMYKTRYDSVVTHLKMNHVLNNYQERGIFLMSSGFECEKFCQFDANEFRNIQFV
jgi:hypothetical protein